MRAAVLEEYGEPLSIESVDAPDPDPDGVVTETMTDFETTGIPVITEF